MVRGSAVLAPGSSERWGYPQAVHKVQRPFIPVPRPVWAIGKSNMVSSA